MNRIETTVIEECAVGNLIADLMRKEVSADCAIYNAGSIRSDCSYNQTIYTVGDLEAIKPYDEKIFLIEVTHEQIKQALENSVSRLPALEGRFCQVSHIYFEFDVSLPAGQRINPATMEINRAKYDPTRIARMAVINYAHAGKDGFECLKSTKLLSASENVRTMSEIMLEFFMMMAKPEFIDEFRIYQIHQEELTQNFIRLRIQQKVDTNKQFAEAAKKWNEDGDEEIKRRRQSADGPPETSVMKTLSSKDFPEEPLELLKTISEIKIKSSTRCIQQRYQRVFRLAVDDKITDEIQHRHAAQQESRTLDGVLDSAEEVSTDRGFGEGSSENDPAQDQTRRRRPHQEHQLGFRSARLTTSLQLVTISHWHRASGNAVQNSWPHKTRTAGN